MKSVLLVAIMLACAVVIERPSLEAQERSIVVGKDSEGSRTWEVKLATPCHPGCRLLSGVAQSGGDLVAEVQYFYEGTDGRTVRLKRVDFFAPLKSKTELSLVLPLDGDAALLVVQPHWTFSKPFTLRLKKNAVDHSLSGVAVK